MAIGMNDTNDTSMAQVGEGMPTPGATGMPTGMQSKAAKVIAKSMIDKLDIPRNHPSVSAEAADIERTKTPSELEDKPLSLAEVETILFEIRLQPNWRREADKAADYYDGNQLDADTVAILEDRGQPELITNLIKPTIDTVLGLEAKSRTDWVVREEDDGQSDGELADAMSIKLKHAETESRADRACSDAYAAQMKTGMAWVEVARDTDPFNPNYRVEYVHRREISWDWRNQKADMDSCRYLVRRRWVDVDAAIAMMPQYAELFRATIDQWAGFDPMIDQETGLIQSFSIERDTKMEAGDWRDNVRRRVCLNEIWYRKWVKGTVMKLPNGRVVEFDLDNEAHCEAVIAGIVHVREAVFQRVRLAWYCGPHFLYDIKSPYKHRSFPYVPFFGYREDLTAAPYGLIRGMFSPQDEINARKSKQLWLLNSRRVIADSDAVEDHDLAAAEISRPDAYIKLNANRRPGSKFEVQDSTALSVAQGQAMQEAKQEIAEASGIHKAMQGQTSASTSGTAINSLIDQGMTTLAEINDNYGFARRLVGELLMSLLQEDLSFKPVSVKLGSGSSARVIRLNEPGMDDEGNQIVKNDVSRLRPRIVLDDIKSTPTYRAQVMAQLTEITKSLPPEAQGAMADLWVEASDLHGKQVVIDRLRTILKLPDDSPAGREAAQAAAKKQEEQQQADFQMVMAEREAKVALVKAQAAKASAEAGAVGQPADGAPQAPDPRIEQMQAENEKLRQQLSIGQMEAANRASENKTTADGQIISARTEITKAKMMADAQARTAMAARDDEGKDDKMLAPLIKMIESLKQELADMKTQDKADDKAEKATEKAEKDAEKKHEKGESDSSAVLAMMAKAIESMAKTQADIAKAIAAPQKPTPKGK